MPGVQITFLVVAPFALGAMIPRIDQRPWQGGFILSTNSKPADQVIYRVWATWRLERLDVKKRADATLPSSSQLALSD